MLPLTQKSFYTLDEDTAQAFDNARPEADRCFTTLLPGGNAYHLDADLFTPEEHENIDPGDPIAGCAYMFGQMFTPDQRQNVLRSLIQLGYAVTPYADHFLIDSWHRDTLTDALAHDICRILSAPKFGPLPTQPAGNIGVFYYLAQETDHDPHGEGHDCGLCDHRGRSYGSSLFLLDFSGLQAFHTFLVGDEQDSLGEWEREQESQMTCYGASIGSSVEHTLEEAMKEGFLVLNYANRYAFLAPWLTLLHPLIVAHTHENDLLPPVDGECHLCRARLVYEIVQFQERGKRGQHS